MIETQLLGGRWAPDDGATRIYGVVVAIVSNLNDPEQLGRVKVSFPWLGDSVDSTWARIAAPLAGNGRGMLMLPEVDDEVLVAFEHGHVERPYIVGALWNGKDKPPAQAVAGGKVKLRSLKTRAGHTIEFQEDEGSQKGHIKITTAGGHTLLLSDDDGKLEIASGKHKLTMDDRGQKLTLAATGSLELSASGCKLAFSQSGLELSFNSNTLSFGPSGGKLEGLPQLTLKGGLLQLNPPG